MDKSHSESGRLNPQTTSHHQPPGQDAQQLLGNTAIQNGMDADPAALDAELEAARNQIRTACYGLGTDEDLVFSTLTGLSPEAKKVAAKDSFIMDWLISDLTASELTQANSILNTTASKEVQTFAADLGQVETYAGLATAVGLFIESQAPLENTLFEGSITIKVYNPAGLGFDLSFVLSGEKTAEGFSLGAGVELFLGWKSPHWEGVFEAQVGWSFSANAVGTGDSAVECLEILGLGLRMGVAKLSESAADAFMSDFNAAEIIDNMDDDSQGDEADTLSLTLGAAFGGGLKIEKLGLETGGNLGTSSEKTLSKGKDGALKTETKDVVTISHETQVGGIAVSVKGQVPLDRNSKPELTITPKFDLPMGDAELLAGMCQQAVVSGVAAATWVVQKATGAPPDIDESFQAAIFTHFYSGLHRGGKQMAKYGAGSKAVTDKLTGESSLVPNVKLKSKVEIPIKIKGGKTSVKLKFLEEMSMEGNLVDLKYKTGQVIPIYG